jgi:hypothetical protein
VIRAISPQTVFIFIFKIVSYTKTMIANISKKKKVSGIYLLSMDE